MPGSIIFQVAAGLVSDESTEQWWIERGFSEKDAESHPEAIELDIALDKLTAFIESISNSEQEPCIWCKGIDFDLPMLKLAYDAVLKPIPWKYRQARDARTVIKLADIPKEEIPHIALDDVALQIKQLKEALNQLPFH